MATDFDFSHASHFLKAEKYLLLVLCALSESKTWGDSAASWTRSASSYFKMLWIDRPRPKENNNKKENTNVPEKTKHF